MEADRVQRIKSMDGRVPGVKMWCCRKVRHVNLSFGERWLTLCIAIDYINELLSERTTLLARLQKARSALPPGHPGLTPLSPDPAWEREWKGGEGKFGGEEEEEGEDSEGEGEGEDDRDGPQVNGTKGKQKSSGGSNTPKTG